MLSSSLQVGNFCILLNLNWSHYNFWFPALCLAPVGVWILLLVCSAWAGRDTWENYLWFLLSPSWQLRPSALLPSMSHSSMRDLGACLPKILGQTLLAGSALNRFIQAAWGRVAVLHFWLVGRFKPSLGWHGGTWRNQNKQVRNDPSSPQVLMVLQRWQKYNWRSHHRHGRKNHLMWKISLKQTLLMPCNIS